MVPEGLRSGVCTLGETVFVPPVGNVVEVVVEVVVEDVEVVVDEDVLEVVEDEVVLELVVLESSRTTSSYHHPRRPRGKGRRPSTATPPLV